MLIDSFEFYYKATKLKDMLRQGAVQWSVDKERLESIAEHIFGCSILSVALKAELGLELDFGRVLEMLTIHELEEIFIGDVTPLDNVSKIELSKNALEEIQKMVSKLNCKTEIVELTNEFNNCLTKEAKFAKAIDKLECVLEFKKYQDMGQVSLSHVTDEMLKNKLLKEYVDSGKYDLADIFFLYHLPAYKEFGIDENFWFKTLKGLKI